jgi:arylformamidase
VANSAEVLAWYAAESETTRRTLDCRLDVQFGSHRGETLDIFPTGRSRPSPVQVFIHGGYWQRLDKADFSYVARAFVPAGAVVVVINYALIPTVGMTELIRQCRAAIAWVHANAGSFGGDPSRIFISGHSAGGHLVAMLMSTDWPAVQPPAVAGTLPADVVKGGCAVSGLYDLEPIRLCYLNDVLGLTPDDVRRLSPVLVVPERSGPLLLAVGALEGPEYHRQTDELAAAWRHRGLRCDVMDMAGLDHFSIAAQLGDPKSELSRAILRQMGLS